MGTWHEEMAEAVALRKKAINGVLRWQGKKLEAERKIDTLSAQRQIEDAPIPAAAVNDDGALLSPDLHATFGITSEQPISNQPISNQSISITA